MTNTIRCFKYFLSLPIVNNMKREREKKHKSKPIDKNIGGA